MKKVNIVGVSGSGKTTLAKRIASECNLRHIEIDRVFWRKDWQPSEEQDFRNRLYKMMDNSPEGGWVIDNYYSDAQGGKPWNEADVIIFLDIPKAKALFRVVARSTRQIIRKELVWGRNTQTWRGQRAMVRSVLRWHRKIQQDMAEFEKNIPKGVNYQHFTSNRAANQWLEELLEQS